MKNRVDEAEGHRGEGVRYSFKTINVPQQSLIESHNGMQPSKRGIFQFRVCQRIRTGTARERRGRLLIGRWKHCAIT
jgi:hypothetical protein